MLLQDGCYPIVKNLFCSIYINIVSEYAKLMQTINFPSLFWGNFVQNYKSF